mgnify:CR=1 FL=1
MKTYDESKELLENSINEHNLVKMKKALGYFEGSLYSGIGFAGPLYYAAECDFAEGVDYLIREVYGELLLGPVQIDQLWTIALFGYPRKGKSIIMVLLENKLFPSESFLASLSLNIRKERESTRDKIISLFKTKYPDIEVYEFNLDPDKIDIRKGYESLFHD